MDEGLGMSMANDPHQTDTEKSIAAMDAGKDSLFGPGTLPVMRKDGALLSKDAQLDALAVGASPLGLRLIALERRKRRFQDEDVLLGLAGLYSNLSGVEVPPNTFFRWITGDLQPSGIEIALLCHTMEATRTDLTASESDQSVAISSLSALRQRYVSDAAAARILLKSVPKDHAAELLRPENFPHRVTFALVSRGVLKQKDKADPEKVREALRYLMGVNISSRTTWPFAHHTPDPEIIEELARLTGADSAFLFGQDLSSHSAILAQF